MSTLPIPCSLTSRMVLSVTPTFAIDPLPVFTLINLLVKRATQTTPFMNHAYHDQHQASQTKEYSPADLRLGTWSCPPVGRTDGQKNWSASPVNDDTLDE